MCVCVCKNHQVPVHGALIYFIWLKSQTNLLLIFSSSLLTIFICLCWTCPSHTYLYIPVNPLCVAVPSSQRSPACPAPRNVCWGTSPNHASCPGPDNLAPQYKQLYTFLVSCHWIELLGENSKTRSLPLALLCWFLPQNSFPSPSPSLFRSQSLTIRPPLLPWLYCLDVLVLSYLITFNSLLHSIDFAITESICCMWSKGGWKGCFSNSFFPP